MGGGGCEYFPRTVDGGRLWRSPGLKSEVRGMVVLFTRRARRQVSLSSTFPRSIDSHGREEPV